MFSIFKRKYPLKEVDFSAIKTDMHSHLVPGIDDGSPDTATSVTLKKGLEALGFAQFITTPHIMWDMYKNTTETIEDALQQLQQEPNQQNIRPAAEYFMDEYFDGLVNRDEPLLTISAKKVLVEFSFVSPPMDLKEKLFNLQMKGYQPILAHPERYQYFSGKKSMYDDFKSMDCLFQVNLLSLSGYYGKIPAELASYLISKKYIDFVGTDLHHQRHLEALQNSKGILHPVSQLLDSGKLQNPSLSL
jgi:protein-tyrosine phosphatase